MKHRLLAVVILTGLCAPAAARTVEERLIAGLKDQGYAIVEDGYTFLGRLRIVAENDTYHREIVVNPGTGEVLRDYTVLLSDLLPPKSQPSEPHASAPALAALVPPPTGTVAAAAAAAATVGMSIAAMAAGTGLQGSASQFDMLLATPILPLGPVAP